MRTLVTHFLNRKSEYPSLHFDIQSIQTVKYEFLCSACMHDDSNVFIVNHNIPNIHAESGNILLINPPGNPRSNILILVDLESCMASFLPVILHSFFEALYVTNTNSFAGLDRVNEKPRNASHFLERPSSLFFSQP